MTIRIRIQRPKKSQSGSATLPTTGRQAHLPLSLTRVRGGAGDVHETARLPGPQGGTTGPN